MGFLKVTPIRTLFGLYPSFIAFIGLLFFNIPRGHCEMLDHDGFINALEVNQNGKVLISGSWDTTIRVWDIPTHAPLLVLDGHLMSVNAISLSPSGSLLASASWDHSS